MPKESSFKLTYTAMFNPLKNCTSILRLHSKEQKQFGSTRNTHCSSMAGSFTAERITSTQSTPTGT